MNRNTRPNSSPSAADDLPIFLIGGHGGELIGNKFTVPSRCYVVVKATASRIQIGDVYWNDMQQMCKIDRKLLQDPVKNIVTLRKYFGNVKVYGPGSTCPYFMYNPIINIPYDGMQKIIPTGSGIIRLNEKMNEFCENYKNKTYAEGMAIAYNSTLMGNPPTIKSLITYLSTFFRHSILPTPTQVIEELENARKEMLKKEMMQQWKYIRVKEKTLEEYVKDQLENQWEIYSSKSQLNNNVVTVLDNLTLQLIHIISEKYILSQKTQCDSAEKYNGGIFYHFVCRGTSVSNDLYHINLKDYATIKHKLNTTISKGTSGPLNSVQTTTNTIISLRPSNIKQSRNKNSRTLLRKEVAATGSNKSLSENEIKKLLNKEKSSNLLHTISNRIEEAAIGSNKSPSRAKVEKLYHESTTQPTPTPGNTRTPTSKLTPKLTPREIIAAHYNDLVAGREKRSKELTEQIPILKKQHANEYDTWWRSKEAYNEMLSKNEKIGKAQAELNKIPAELNNIIKRKNILPTIKKEEEESVNSIHQLLNTRKHNQYTEKLDKLKNDRQKELNLLKKPNSRQGGSRRTRRKRRSLSRK